LPIYFPFENFFLLSKRCLHEQENVGEVISRRKIGFSALRFVPKVTGARSIVNLKRSQPTKVAFLIVPMFAVLSFVALKNFLFSLSKNKQEVEKYLPKEDMKKLQAKCPNFLFSVNRSLENAHHALKLEVVRFSSCFVVCFSLCFLRSP